MLRTNNISKRMHPGNTVSILRDAIAGDIVYMEPGEYNDPIYVQEKLHLIGCGYGFTKILGGLAFESADSMISECSIGNNDTDTPIANSDYGYKLRNCEIRGKKWNLPTEVVDLFNCIMYPTSQTGWLFSGNGSSTRMYDCRFGEDFPIAASQMGIIIEDNAKIFMKNCEFYKAAGETTPGILVDGAGAKLFMKHCRMIVDNNIAILGSGEGIVVLQETYVENNHATLPAVDISEDSTILLVGSYLSAKVSDYALRVHSTSNSRTHMTAYEGKIVLEAPLEGDQGDFHFVGGGNSLLPVGETRLVDTNAKGIGTPIRTMMGGQQAFDGNAASVQFTAVQGTYRMGRTATIIVGVTEEEAVKHDDDTLSIDKDDGDFIVRRPTVDNTADLKLNFIGLER